MMAQHQHMSHSLFSYPAMNRMSRGARHLFALSEAFLLGPPLSPRHVAVWAGRRPPGRSSGGPAPIACPSGVGMQATGGRGDRSGPSQYDAVREKVDNCTPRGSGL